MCISATALMVGSLIVGAAGTAASMYAADTAAKQQESNLKFQAAQTAADAKAMQGEAEVEAMRIRRAAKAQRATATAQAAASGIDVNSPTAIRINEEITKNSEEDALLTIMGGGNRSARMGQQAYMDRQGASLARSEGRMQNTGTLLSGAAGAMNTYSNWKRAG